MKRYGIHFTLPPGDTRRAAHLLGANWEAYQWFDTAEQRDLAYQQATHYPPYYRSGDIPSEIITKVER